MVLEIYRNKQGDIRYKLDGKGITAKDAKQMQAEHPDIVIEDNTVETVNVPDRLAAIRNIESATSSTFFIDHTVKIEGGVFARNENGATVELFDDRVKVVASRKTVIYKLDIPESRFIEELNAAVKAAQSEGRQLDTFSITGISGTVYTYDADTLDVIDTAIPVVEEKPSAENTSEKLVDYIIRQRRLVLESVSKDYREKIVA